jgi:Mor family transcriptional regulator
MNYELLKELAYRYTEDVMYPFCNLMEPIGFDGICAVAHELGGIRVYIPRAKTIFRECAARQIRKEFNGHNFRELCKKYGYCEKTIKVMTQS